MNEKKRNILASILLNLLNAFPPRTRFTCVIPPFRSLLSLSNHQKWGNGEIDNQFPAFEKFELNGRIYMLEKGLGGVGEYAFVRFGFDANDPQIKVAVKTLRSTSKPFSLDAVRATKAGQSQWFYDCLLDL